MVDDLDELLDEVESKFCGEGILTAASANSFATRYQSESRNEGKEKLSCSATGPRTSFKAEDDLDSLLEDLFEDDSLDSEPVKPYIKASSNTPIKSSSQLQGKKACDQLRCTACDFRVATFDEYEWDKSCDYLFFRNNMPNFNKLKGKMNRRIGTRAYACQCNWRSIKELTALGTNQELRWVCGKHTE
ncbi:cilia- and flagella-associated protein 418 isoform X2 [Latimeria chalumnae]|uniref:cilia- and flagella-associated protein 418 isoform X2 n=1 Tax=Latimeria chalumnae TaxID=7897 RepID=UPI00313E0647